MSIVSLWLSPRSKSCLRVSSCCRATVRRGVDARLIHLKLQKCCSINAGGRALSQESDSANSRNFGCNARRCFTSASISTVRTRPVCSRNPRFRREGSAWASGPSSGPFATCSASTPPVLRSGPAVLTMTFCNLRIAARPLTCPHLLAPSRRAGILSQRERTTPANASNVVQAVAFSPWGEGGRPARMRKKVGPVEGALGWLDVDY